jgi:hypothetical protein
MQKVTYEVKCRGLCDNDTHLEIRRMRDTLLIELSKVCNPSIAREGGLLLVCEVARTSEAPLPHFQVVCCAELCASASRYGRFPSKQDFLEYKVREHRGHQTFEGSVLSPVVLPYHFQSQEVPRAFRYFMGQHRGHGALGFLKEEDLVAKVLHFLLPDWPCWVRFRFLRHRPHIDESGAFDNLIVDGIEDPSEWKHQVQY